MAKGFNSVRGLSPWTQKEVCSGLGATHMLSAESQSSLSRKWLNMTNTTSSGPEKEEGRERRRREKSRKTRGGGASFRSDVSSPRWTVPCEQKTQPSLLHNV